MKTLGFIMALTASTVTAGEGAGRATVPGHGTDTLRGQPAEAGYLRASSPAAKLDDRLDQVVSELNAALEQRLAARAAAQIAEDTLLVSTD